MNYIGCSGWHYREWKDLFYAGIRQKDWFSHYAEKFNTVEINNTFYRLPNATMVKNWYQNAPTDFVYTIKANRMITHYKKFKQVKSVSDDFYRICTKLQEKLGCILFQLPKNFHYSQQNLANIIDTLNPKFKNVVEFRHASWWNDEVYRAFKDNHIIFCSISAPELPEKIVYTGTDIYIRLHGLTWYDYKYTNHELSSYAQSIKKRTLNNVWCYFNNDVNAYAVDNALKLARLLRNT